MNFFSGAVITSSLAFGREGGDLSVLCLEMAWPEDHGPERQGASRDGLLGTGPKRTPTDEEQMTRLKTHLLAGG